MLNIIYSLDNIWNNSLKYFDLLWPKCNLTYFTNLPILSHATDNNQIIKTMQIIDHKRTYLF